MKHLLRNMIGIFAVTLFVLLFYACEQDPQIKKYEYPMPEVSGMSPNIGYVSSQVVITGTNFGDRTEPVKVFFGSALDCRSTCRHPHRSHQASQPPSERRN